MSAQPEALQPNFQEKEYTSSYLNLFGGGFKKSCIISMKDFPNGYSLFLFNLQSQTVGDLYSREKHGNVRVKVKFAKPLQENVRGHSGRVVTNSLPTSEAGVQFPARPQVGKLVVACRWSAVYSTEP